MSAPIPVAVRLARLIHRALLLLSPRRVRSGYRKEMIATFADASAEAGRDGWTAILSLLLREARDLATSRRANRPAGLTLAAADARRQRPAWPDSIRLTAWRQAWRALVRRPAYLSTSVLTLAVGTAATTAVFALVDTVLLKPLPYPDADRLVTVYESSPASRDRTSLVAPGRLEDWQKRTRSFVALSGSYGESVTETSGDAPERLAARRVAPRFFTVFGTPPVIGRAFTEAEEQANGPGAAVISDGLWARRFGRQPGVVGQVLRIGGRSHAIVGVMPATFTTASIDVWLPAQTPASLLRVREARFLGGIGRLRPGVSIDGAVADLRAVQAQLGVDHPRSDAGWSAEVRSLKDARVGDSRRGLILVFGAVAALWIVALANVAGLTLVQVRRRARELAIRAVLGGSQLRVLGTVAREGMLMALLGGATGVLAAFWLVSAMPAVLTATPRMSELVFDTRAAGFAAVTTFAAACLIGLVPMVAGVRRQPARAMAAGGRSVAGGRHRLQRTLVVGQVALSVLLVGSSTMLLRSYYRLTNVPTGFDAAETLTFEVGARWDEDRGRIGRFQADLLNTLARLPHVRAAGMTNFLPATNATLRYPVRVEGLAGSNADGTITAGARMIGGDYLRAIQAPLLSGAWCPPLTTDMAAPRSVLVNRSFVDAHAAGENLLGRSLWIAALNGPPLTIAGVIGDLTEDSLAAPPAPYVYSCDAAGSWPDPHYVVRSSDPGALAADLRHIVRTLDADRALFGLQPVQAVVDASLDRPRLDAALLGLFASVAVGLAALGLYSLFMLIVSERAREMAVRLAIGATPGRVLGLVMSGAGRLLAAGVVVGIVLTLVAERLMSGALFGASALDVPALAAAIGVLTLASALAVALPARRAARIAPVDALRGD